MANLIRRAYRHNQHPHTWVKFPFYDDLTKIELDPSGVLPFSGDILTIDDNRIHISIPHKDKPLTWLTYNFNDTTEITVFTCDLGHNIHVIIVRNNASRAMDYIVYTQLSGYWLMDDDSVPLFIRTDGAILSNNDNYHSDDIRLEMDDRNILVESTSLLHDISLRLSDHKDVKDIRTIGIHGLGNVTFITSNSGVLFIIVEGLEPADLVYKVDVKPDMTINTITGIFTSDHCIINLKTRNIQATKKRLYRITVE